MARNRTVIIKDWPGYNKKKHRTLIGHILCWEKQAKQLGLKLDDTDALKADRWEKHYKVNLESFKQVGPPIHTQVNICRTTKVFYPCPHRLKSRELLHLSGKQSRTFIEIFTGQSNLNYIQNKVTGQDLLCRFCEENEETFDHLLLECPCFETLRRNQNLTHCSGTHSWKIQTLLNFSYTKTIDSARSNTAQRIVTLSNN